MNENPAAGFGEVSKIVGIEWKRLSDEDKREYETRAQYIAAERAKAELLTPNSKLPQVIAFKLLYFLFSARANPYLLLPLATV
jgi:hypothetical protein